MRRKIFFWSLIIFTCVMATSMYAGKVELTTYYPAPYGEYNQLSANKQTYASDKVQPGTSGRIRLEPQAGDPSVTDAGGIWASGIAKIGEIAYSTLKQGLVIWDGTAWASAGGTGNGQICFTRNTTSSNPNCNNVCDPSTETLQAKLGFFGECSQYVTSGTTTLNGPVAFPPGNYGNFPSPCGVFTNYGNINAQADRVVVGYSCLCCKN